MTSRRIKLKGCVAPPSRDRGPLQTKIRKEHGSPFRRNTLTTSNSTAAIRGGVLHRAIRRAFCGGLEERLVAAAGMWPADLRETLAGADLRPSRKRAPFGNVLKGWMRERVEVMTRGKDGKI